MRCGAYVEGPRFRSCRRLFDTFLARETESAAARRGEHEFASDSLVRRLAHSPRTSRSNVEFGVGRAGDSRTSRSDKTMRLLSLKMIARAYGDADHLGG